MIIVTVHVDLIFIQRLSFKAEQVNYI